jgi:hypothetical protein
MKCRNCDKEAIYDDGLCEECHQAAAENERVQVLSREEKNSFRGQTIDEDGTVHDSQEDNQTVFDTVFQSEHESERPSGVHLYTSNLSWRFKLALGFIIFCIIAIIISALGFLIIALPYLLTAVAAIFIIKIIGAFLRR